MAIDRNAPSVMHNVEAIRNQLLRDAIPPRGLVRKAWGKLEEQLEAKKTYFATFQGTITAEREINDNQTQQGAADKILSAAGVYVRDREARPVANGVALEIDPTTGVMRIVVGAIPALPGVGALPVTEGSDPVDAESLTPEAQLGESVPVTPALSAAVTPIEEVISASVEREEPVQILKTRGKTKDQINAAMLDILNGIDPA